VFYWFSCVGGLKNPPSELQKLIFYDIFGICMSKNLSLVFFFFLLGFAMYCRKKMRHLGQSSANKMQKVDKLVGCLSPNQIAL